MLAGLESEDGQRGVPVVGGGDGDGVDVLGFEHAAEVLLGLGRVAEGLLGSAGKSGEDLGVDIAAIGHAGGFAVVLKRGKMGVSAPVQAVDGKVKPVVGAEDLRIAFCRGCESRARHSRLQGRLQRFAEKSSLSPFRFMQQAAIRGIDFRRLVGCQVRGCASAPIQFSRACTRRASRSRSNTVNRQSRGFN